MDDISIKSEHFFLEIIAPFIKSVGFKQSDKIYKANIQSLSIIYSSRVTNQYISFEYSLHHYDLADGIFVYLYTDNEKNDGYARLSLNEIASANSKSRKVYSQLIPESSLPMLLDDLQNYCDFYLKHNDLEIYKLKLAEKRQRINTNNNAL